MTDQRTHHRGQTLLESLVLIVTFVVLAALGVLLVDAGLLRPATACGGPSMRERVFVRQIHQAFLVMAEENPGGHFPLPSAIAAGSGGLTPDRNASLDTTANLYSCLIAQNYFGPDLVVGPQDPNPRVAVDDDYRMDAWQPNHPTPSYWDPSFEADLDVSSNASFAHTPMVGRWLEEHWNNNLNPDIAVLSIRGPSPPSSPSSLTLHWDGGGTTWVGPVCFNDNSLQVLADTTFGHLQRSGGGPVEFDEIFAPQIDQSDRRVAADIWLSFTRSIRRIGPRELDVTTQHD